jgi:hypothetical protein
VLGDSGSASASVNVDVTSKLTRGGPTGLLSQLLSASTEVQELVQCLIARLFATDGSLGEAALQEVLARRVAEVREAVVAESARWGDSATFDGENNGLGWYGRADFERETAWLRDSFLPQRGAVVQRQLRQWWSRHRFMPEPTVCLSVRLSIAVCPSLSLSPDCVCVCVCVCVCRRNAAWSSSSPSALAAVRPQLRTTAASFLLGAKRT